MGQYFSFFPKVLYSLSETDDGVRIPNIATAITSRVKMNAALKNRIGVAYTYTVKDGETPEMLAHRVYGDPHKHWIILLFNNIVDPLYDWVMEATTFDKFIEKKYGSYEEALSTIIEYRITYSQYNQTTRNKFVETFNIDEETYNETPPLSVEFYYFDDDIIETTITTSILNGYTYEVDLNNSKRKIKIPDAEYIPQIMTEFENLMKVPEQVII